MTTSNSPATGLPATGLYVIQRAGNGFHVLNEHEHWTPSFQLAHRFPEARAAHLARHKHGHAVAELPGGKPTASS
jgi:hypothetical protein